jgi:hypothetical protein
MKTLALAFAALVLAPAAAHAGTGGFAAIGIGLPVSTGGDLSDWGADGKAGSLFVGQHLNKWVGVEAGLSVYGLSSPNGNGITNIGLAAAGRFQYPVTPVIAPFVRLGIEKTWMDRGRAEDFSGTGWMAGLGVEYKLNLSFTQGGVWAEYLHHDATFVNDRSEQAGSIGTLQIGVTFGF